MSDLARLEEIARAATTWESDSNMTPFYNDAEGNSRGGNCDGSYCLYGPSFKIEGDDYEYEGPTLSERCSKADAEYITTFTPARVLAMLAVCKAARDLHSGCRSTFDEDMEDLGEALKALEAPSRPSGGER